MSTTVVVVQAPADGGPIVLPPIEGADTNVVLQQTPLPAPAADDGAVLPPNPDEQDTCDEEIAKTAAIYLRLQVKENPPRNYGVCELKEREIGKRCGVAIMLTFANFRMWMWILAASSVLMMFNTFSNMAGNGNEAIENSNFITFVSLGNLALTKVVIESDGTVSDDHNLSYSDLKGIYFAQLFFFYIVFNMVLGHLSYEALYNSEISAEIDDNTTTAADYALMLFDLPAECKSKDIQDCFEDALTCENAYEAIPQFNVPAKTAKLVPGMCCACFDVKDLVMNFREKRVSEIIRNQVKKQISTQGDTDTRTKLLKEYEEKLVEQVAAYREAVTGYEERAAEASCTGVGFIVFQYLEHRDAAYDYFCPGWCTWFYRTLCCCCATQPPRICGYQLGSFMAIFFCCFRKIRLTRAPEPSEIYWENFGITAWQRSKKWLKNSIIILILVGLGTGIIVGLEFGKKEATDATAKTIIGTLVAILVCAINEVLRIACVSFTDSESQPTQAERTDSLIQKLAVAYVVVTCGVPLLITLPSGLTTGQDWWTAEGISYAGFMLVFTNCGIPSFTLWLGIDRWAARFLGARSAITQKQLDDAYAPAAFDVAAEYGNMIKTFALGLFFAPFVPLTIPITVLALLCQYWVLKSLLCTTFKNPPAMAPVFQKYVRHILRGAMFVWIFVVTEVYERACEGTAVCDKAYKKTDACACNSVAGFWWVVMLVTWCAWTFLPLKSTLCRCFPYFIVCCMRCCSKKAQVAPEPENAEYRAPEHGYPMTAEEIWDKEKFDGPGSWTYKLPSPETLEPNGSKDALPQTPDGENKDPPPAANGTTTTIITTTVVSS